MKEARRTACLVACLILSFPLRAQEEDAAEESGLPMGPIGDIDLTAEESDFSAKASRFTLAHEGSYGEQGVVNNRSWLRVEYSRFFWDSFFVQLDSKLNTYWSNDHRAAAEDETVLLDTNTPEAFLQYSAAGGRTSIKLGQQRLIWGESEAGAITDEVSPRDFSEAFLIPLEESRRGQVMAVLDQFAASGDWTAFFAPDAKFNQLAREGTSYYVDPFAGGAEVRDDPAGKSDYEYGGRWKRTFNKSDVSLMAADLIDNDYAFRQDGVTDDGRLQISRVQQRFTMIGGAFNYATGKYLLKGEIAYKSAKAFNDAAFQIVEKDVLDSALGLTYSLGRSDTIGFEIVNSHVFDWRNDILVVPRNTNSLVLNTNLFFFNDNLSVTWLMIYGEPHTSYQSSLRTSYKWSDNLTFSVDAHLVDVPSERSPIYSYRDRDQIVFRVQFQL